jgi:cyclopropane-fatty-acyl-phospholipid synthase
MNNDAMLTHSDDDRVVAATRELLDWLFSRLERRDFDIRLWNGEVLSGNTGYATFTLRLNHPGALRAMFCPPVELSLGEAFIYNDFDIEGDIHAGIRVMSGLSPTLFSTNELFTLMRRWAALPRTQRSRSVGRGPARLAGRLHSRERDHAAIRYHYDVGNDFYALWLDGRMQYSCAYFPAEDADLDTAQEYKLELICRKLQLQPGDRLLDIGCGWGGLIRYAVENYGVRALGVTLSEKQVEFANYQIARAGLGDRAVVKLLDYRDGGIGSFDKIVSVGMFEHVGRSQLPQYFAEAYRLLKPGGLFLNHGISRRAPRQHVAVHDPLSHCIPPEPIGNMSLWQKFVNGRILGAGSFIQRYIFPDGELIPVSEAGLVAEKAGFELRDVENLREHYALTLRQWVKRLEMRRDEATAVTDEVTYRTWRLYMASVTQGFEEGLINVNQMLLSKPENGQSCLPLTRAALYSDSLVA